MFERLEAKAPAQPSRNESPELPQRNTKIPKENFGFLIATAAIFFIAEEQAMGWYYYLEEQVRFPFQAKCIAQRAISPLRKAQEVQVVGLAPAQECEREMFVTVP